MYKNTLTNEQINAIAKVTGFPADTLIRYEIDEVNGLVLTPEDGTFDARQYLDWVEIPLNGNKGEVEYIDGLTGPTVKVSWSPKQCSASYDGDVKLRVGICTLAEFLEMTDDFDVELFFDLDEEGLTGIEKAAYFGWLG